VTIGAGGSTHSTAYNKRASAYAAFGRSGATGPMCVWSLGTRFLISKSAESGDEVAGRFGGPERYLQSLESQGIEPEWKKSLGQVL